MITYYFPVPKGTPDKTSVDSGNFESRLICRQFMDKIVKLESVTQFNAERGQETLHPLISVLDQSKSKPILSCQYRSALYIIFLKDIKCEEIKYGRNHYDYQEETLIFIAPGQVFGMESEGVTIQPNGWALVFHPDLIRGTVLGKHIEDFSFFSYATTEALHISQREKQLLLECLNKIQYELEQNTDKHSKKLIVSVIELFLNYSVRFYDRQFMMRDHFHKDLLARFEHLLMDYFQSGKPRELGLPSVKHCAKELHLSANYFGDLVKRETGITAQEFILERLISVAKERVYENNKPISEIAWELGFKYPQHFTRLFKQRVGKSPLQYRITH